MKTSAVYTSSYSCDITCVPYSHACPGRLPQTTVTHAQGYLRSTTCCTGIIRHLRRLPSLRRQLGRDVMARLASALVLSRLDYCNAVFTGLPASTLAPLRRVLHAAARVVMDLRPRDHVSPALRDLHWMPIKQRTEFKLCLLVHKTLVGHSPAYISDLLTSAADVSGRPAPRTSSRGSCYGPIVSSDTEHSASQLLERGIDCHPTSDSCVRHRHSGAISRHFYSLFLTELL